MRRSVFFRFLGVTVLVALCSIATTAWLAAQLTRASIEREQGQELSVDARIYTTLLTHAVDHRDWTSVGPVVAELVRQHPTRRVTLLSKDGVVLADVGGHGPLPTTASAVVDPLSVDPVLVPDAPADRVDPRLGEPYRMLASLVPEDSGRVSEPVAEQELDVRAAPADSYQLVQSFLKCDHVQRTDNDPGDFQRDCAELLEGELLAAARALLALQERTNACLTDRGREAVQLDLDLTPHRGDRWSDDQRTAAEACVSDARHAHLSERVPPPALLYVTVPTGAPVASFDLSPDNWWRVAAAAGGIALAAVVVTALACARIIRPLRDLTTAAHRMSLGGDTEPLVVRGRDEIARLTEAFNTMARARARLEGLRKAAVSDTAHELRTPLSNIRGWLEAAEDGVTERDPELIALLLKEALALQHIVDDLQDLAVADAGGLRLAVAPQPLTTVLDNLRAAHETTADRAAITLTTSAPDDLTAEADPVRLRQVLDNLLANAIRHVPPGGRIDVTAHRDGEEAVIEVADTGTGIAPEDLPHVFDRFWRAEKSRSRRTGGSGLGLAIVRKLVEAHGGTVSATSDPGRGSVFTVRLPAPPDPD
ncbi:MULTISPECIES: HAMP domain-containing sensor histidine kinase [Actinosynnema]|uniref:sensor histidine kinase n=1 Tax=Actinosynnema TaxID=40566 RepID=UPI0020A498E2|nr:HAMP domain-containing sensor histidine kinase [Actinosynnema pretiosum]MCP2094933.1 two-component system, OmpR family, sensor histidine kinase BaeS [Actinosynnema pretiosum]